MPMSGNKKWKMSLRLDFRYENYNIVLESQTRIEIIPPPSDPIDQADDYNGYYVKLTDGEGRVIYVQRLQNPFRTETEAYGDDAPGLITYESLKDPDLTFSILIPDPEAVFSLEIINNPLQPELFFKIARQSFTFTIDPSEVILPPIAIAERVENGVILGKEKIVDHGNDNECWNLSILAEGYKENEIPKFISDANKFVNVFKNFSPFNEFWEKTNVYILKVTSTDSGADLPAPRPLRARAVNHILLREAPRLRRRRQHHHRHKCFSHFPVRHFPSVIVLIPSFSKGEQFRHIGGIGRSWLISNHPLS